MFGSRPIAAAFSIAGIFQKIFLIRALVEARFIIN